MKKWQKVLSIIIVSILLLFLTRSALYNLVIKYEVDDSRPDLAEERCSGELDFNQENKEDIDKKISEFNSSTDWIINDVIKLSLNITKQKIDFKNCNDHVCNINGMDLTHCRGFSFYFSSVCNYILTKKHMTDWKAVSKVGKLYFLNYNIHPGLEYLVEYPPLSCWTNKESVMNHDFVCIQNKVDTIYVDPTLYEFTCIKKIALKK